jgi:hypothetical protein
MRFAGSRAVHFVYQIWCFLWLVPLGIFLLLLAFGATTGLINEAKYRELFLIWMSILMVVSLWGGVTFIYRIGLKATEHAQEEMKE